MSGEIIKFGLIAALLIFLPGARADWTFVIIGDTRDARDTTTGVSPDLNTIATKISEIKPDLLLVAGDLCNGAYTNGQAPLTFAQQFDNWKIAMSPVTASNIPIYTVRGNHECNGDTPAAQTEQKQDYYNSFAAYMPGNGPNNGTNDDQRGFTYSFAHSNATFIAVDQYSYYDKTSEHGYHSIDQAWLDQQLQAAPTPYKIVMAHEPVYMTLGHANEEHFFGTNAAGETRLTNFWNSLGVNGSRLYASGHVHALSVGLINDNNGTGVYQLTAGNGGAPLELVETNRDASVDVLFTNGSNFGFTLATVGDDHMTLQYYLLNTNDSSWSTASYSTTIYAVPEPSSVLLLAAGLLGWYAWRRRPGYRRIPS